MSDKLKSVIVGVVSLLAIGMLYWGVNYLKGVNVMNDKRVFHAYYTDIAGLTEGNSVTIKGYKVGTVTQISFDQQSTHWWCCLALALLPLFLHCFQNEKHLKNMFFLILFKLKNSSKTTLLNQNEKQAKRVPFQFLQI